MRNKQRIILLVIVIVVYISSSGCASYSVRKDGKTSDLLGQAKVFKNKSQNSVGVPVDVKGWGYLADLPSALTSYGYHNEINNPIYRIEADVVFDMGQNLGTKIAWDIIMAIPSLVLPVPMFGGRTAKVSFTISDAASGKQLSQKEEILSESLTAYSIYGFMNIGKMQNGLVEATAILIDEELKKLK